jgi:hypothetical protein
MKTKLILFFIAGCISYSRAQENTAYQKPPKEILQLVDYERAPQVHNGLQKGKYDLPLP